jgi:hypothetical protein
VTSARTSAADRAGARAAADFQRVLQPKEARADIFGLGFGKRV